MYVPSYFGIIFSIDSLLVNNERKCSFGSGIIVENFDKGIVD
jgi:hypothetical protein